MPPPLNSKSGMMPPTKIFERKTLMQWLHLKVNKRVNDAKCLFVLTILSFPIHSVAIQSYMQLLTAALIKN